MFQHESNSDGGAATATAAVDNPHTQTTAPTQIEPNNIGDNRSSQQPEQQQPELLQPSSSSPSLPQLNSPPLQLPESNAPQPTTQQVTEQSSNSSAAAALPSLVAAAKASPKSLQQPKLSQRPAAADQPMLQAQTTQIKSSGPNPSDLISSSLKPSTTSPTASVLSPSPAPSTHVSDFVHSIGGRMGRRSRNVIADDSDDDAVLAPPQASQRSAAAAVVVPPRPQPNLPIQKSSPTAIVAKSTGAAAATSTILGKPKQQISPPVPKKRPAVESSSSSSSGSSSSGSDSGSDSDDSSSSGSGSSDSSSSSSSDSGESDSSAKHAIVGGQKLRVQPKAKTRPTPKAKAKSVSRTKRKLAAVGGESPAQPRAKKIKKEEEESSGGEDEDDEEGVIGGHVVKSRIGSRTDTEKLIAKILCRWWYVLPPWPPADFDFNAVLLQRKLKVVALEEWEQLDDVDENGFTKVYPISHYPGIYRDPQGNAVDLRPLENKPCYTTFKSKSIAELHELLVKALRAQISELNKSGYRITAQATIAQMQKSLQLELRVAEEALTKLKRRRTYIENKDVTTMNGSAATD